MSGAHTAHRGRISDQEARGGRSRCSGTKPEERRSRKTMRSVPADRGNVTSGASGARLAPAQQEAQILHTEAACTGAPPPSPESSWWLPPCSCTCSWAAATPPWCDSQGAVESAGVAAQRQRREQHDQQNDTAGALHAGNPNIGTVQRPLLRDSVPVMRRNSGWLSRHVSPAGPMCCTTRAQAGTRAPSRPAAVARRPRVVSFRSNVS